jgi:PAS domain S-box-containing protein
MKKDRVTRATSTAAAGPQVDESERRFRQMIDALPAAIYTTDAQGRLTHFNPAAVELSGRKPQIGTDEWCVSWKLYRPDGTPLPHGECPMAIALKQGRIRHGEEIIVERPDGTRLWCAPYPTPLRDATGKVIGGINMLLDITERKHAEQRLRDSEQRFTQFMQHLPGLAWIKDSDGCYVYANEAAQKAFRTERADLYGKSDREVFPPETATQFREHDLRVVDSESSIQIVEALTHPDGIVHHSIVSKFAIPGPNGRAPMVGGIAVDITDLKEAEEALRYSEATFRALAEASPGLIWRLDPRGRFAYVNPRFLEYFDMTSEEVLGDTWDSLVHPEDRAAYIAAIAASQRSRERFQAVARVRDKRGEGRWVESHALPLAGAHDGYLGHVGFSLDITQRNQEAVTHARLAALVESSDDAIVSKDLNGVITSWNAGAQRLFGYTAEEAVGQSVTLLIPPERFDEEPGVLQRIRRGDKVDHYETVRRRKDGRLIDVSLTVSPIRNFKGDVVGASKIARDITESKHAAEMLRHANRRKDEFLAMLAHELRNPLAPILVSLEILRQAKSAVALDGSDVTALDLNQRAGSAVDVLERQVGQMVRLVDDLLDASRISRGKIELRRERIELSTVVHHAVEVISSLAERKGQELTVTLPAVPVFVDADPTRLAQVVGNLLNNACKFTDRGGRIWLTVEREEEADGDGSAVIRVGDTGIGIAADQLGRVFELFTQVDTSIERSTTGLGIGLTLAKSLTEMHGGTLEVSSAGIGQGSEFVVRLPIIVASSAPVASAEAEPTASVPLRILIVDDNRDAAAMLAVLLKFAGHATHTVHDGLAAVEATETLDPDVVLLDIGLPGLNGYEAARRIRERQGIKSGRPVLFALTGWGQEEDRRRSHEAGFDAHLVKPVDAAVLGKMLAGLGPRKPEGSQRDG